MKGEDMEKEVEKAQENIFIALAAAQAEMGPVVKGATNPHYNKKYADLADVMQVALPALNQHGIAAWHSIERSDGVSLMRTTLTHGDSMTSIHCDVPLIVAQNNMQGMKSATTYAKRIGIESLTGIAPDDDDGNDAAKNPPPKNEPKPEPPATINDTQYINLRDMIEEAGVTEQDVLKRVGAPSLEEFPLNRYAATVKGLEAKIAKDKAAKAKELIGDDDIPYEGANQ